MGRLLFCAQEFALKGVRPHTTEKMIKLFANSLECTKEFAECSKYLRKRFGVHQRVCGVQQIFAQIVWSAPKSLRSAHMFAQIVWSAPKSLRSAQMFAQSAQMFAQTLWSAPKSLRSAHMFAQSLWSAIDGAQKVWNPFRSGSAGIKFFESC